MARRSPADALLSAVQLKSHPQRHVGSDRRPIPRRWQEMLRLHCLPRCAVQDRKTRTLDDPHAYGQPGRGNADQQRDRAPLPFR
jgi:hypothetical protein